MRRIPILMLNHSVIMVPFAGCGGYSAPFRKGGRTGGPLFGVDVLSITTTTSVAGQNLNETAL